VSLHRACGQHALFGDIAVRFPPATLRAIAGAPFAPQLPPLRAPQAPLQPAGQAGQVIKPSLFGLVVYF